MTDTDISTGALTTSEFDEGVLGAFAERLFGDALGTINLFTAYLGVRLGLYEALAGAPATPPQLAERAGIARRYAREWLEQQTVAGFVTCGDRTAPADQRVFALPPEHAAALLDQEHPAYVGALTLAGAGIASVLPQLLVAYRTGGGVPYAAYGADFRDGQAGFNKPAFTNDLAANWLTHFPSLHARLTAGEPVRIADIACGAGWSTISMAKAFPNSVVAGYDIDDASVADARRNAAAAGVADRVTFEVKDAADLPDGSFDLVTVFEAVHDMSHPVEVLTELRRLRAPGGHVLVVDEKVADSFAESDGPIEAFMYGASVLHCLPVGLADENSAGTGAVMRTGAFTDYALAAGFGSVAVLPVEHDLFRFYSLV